MPMLSALFWGYVAIAAVVTWFLILIEESTDLPWFWSLVLGVFWPITMIAETVAKFHRW